MKRFAKRVLLPLARNVLAAGALLGLVGLLFVSTQQSRASQASCIMPTSGTVSGLTLVNDINACNQSLISVWSGGSAPPGPVAGMFWYNTNTNYIQQYDGASWINLWLVDATNHLIVPPIGGGGATASIVSATTTDIGSVPQSYVTITGTTTITGLGSSAVSGRIIFGKFSGVLTLTYNATTLIIPGAQNITTQAGDTFSAIYLGAGNWQILAYTPVSLPTKASPTTSDFVLIQDNASANASKKSLISSLLALVGVTAIDSQVGSFTTGNGIDSPSKVIELTAARRTLPGTSLLTTGTNLTYTTPTGALWLEVRIVAGGGGGGGGQNTVAAGTGTSTCWGVSGSACGTAIISVPGGGGGSALIAGAGGQGGLSAVSLTRNGVGGGAPGVADAGYNGVGGTGGGSGCLGGGGPGSSGSATGTAGTLSTGGGGGGGGATNNTLTGSTGGGGGGGGCIYAIFNSPAATYVYTVGTGGAGGAGGSAGASAGGAGGAGADGRIEVIAHFGS